MFQRILLAACLVSAVTSATAQTRPPADVPKDCPPGAGANAPSIGGDQKGNLSDKLASSKGIICPPAGIDSGMQQKPQEGGSIKVVPPPGSPGGDQRVQPK
jgi:hypothetical protein